MPIRVFFFDWHSIDTRFCSRFFCLLCFNQTDRIANYLLHQLHRQLIDSSILWGLHFGRSLLDRLLLLFRVTRRLQHGFELALRPARSQRCCIISLTAFCSAGHFFASSLRSLRLLLESVCNLPSASRVVSPRSDSTIYHQTEKCHPTGPLTFIYSCWD